MKHSYVVGDDNDVDDDVGDDDVGGDDDQSG